MDGCCQLDFLPCFPYVFQCVALFFLCGYHAHFCVIDGVVCTADDNKRPDGKLFGVQPGSGQRAVHVLYHQLCHDGMLPCDCQDFLRGAELRRHPQCQCVYLRCQGSRGQHCQGIACQSAQPLPSARIHCGRT